MPSTVRPLATPLIFVLQMGIDTPESKMMARSLEEKLVLCILLSARRAQRQLQMEDALPGE